VHFPVLKGVMSRRSIGTVKAVDGVSLPIRNGECFGLIGESGCGKTTTARTILRMVKPTAGTILFRETDIWGLDKEQLRDYRCSVQAVFQDPYGSLNPRLRVDRIISEPITANGSVPVGELRERVARLLDLVGLDTALATNYPHEFSGGQRQRIALARAIASNPNLVVLDEPVSALDVSIRAQMMNLLMEVRQKLGLTYLLIAHDLSVIYNMSDTVAVMYLGKVVELASSENLYARVLHPYTQALFSAAMPTHPDERRETIELKGEVPSALNPPSGCHFHPRCPQAQPECAMIAPKLTEVFPGHWAACHLHTGLISPPAAGGDSG
jgi:oligopeptide/dipeptide ABC transporter ATP-binding protein